MRIKRQKNYSWNDWLDKRIENSEKRKDKMREWNKAYRDIPLTPDEKRISDKLRDKIKNSGVIIVNSPNKGGGYSPGPEFIPKDKLEKFGLDPQKLKPGQPLSYYG